MVPAPIVDQFHPHSLLRPENDSLTLYRYTLMTLLPDNWKFTLTKTPPEGFPPLPPIPQDVFSLYAIAGPAATSPSNDHDTVPDAGLASSEKITVQVGEFGGIPQSPSHILVYKFLDIYVWNSETRVVAGKGRVSFEDPLTGGDAA